MAQRLEQAAAGRYLLNTVVIVLVLGVLPFVLDAWTVWKVLGLLASVAFAGHGVRLFWRHAASTDPRHLRRLA